MKGRFIGALTGLVLLFLVGSGVSFCCRLNIDEQSKPKHPISIKGIPYAVAKVVGKCSTGQFVIAYRFTVRDQNNNEYVIVSTRGALLKGNEYTFGGPGMVPKAITAGFAKVTDALDRNIVSRREKLMEVYGDLVFEKTATTCWSLQSVLNFIKGKENKEAQESALYFENKPVVLLFKAVYDGLEYEIDRSPGNNG